MVNTPSETLLEKIDFSFVKWVSTAESFLIRSGNHVHLPLSVFLVPSSIGELEEACSSHPAKVPCHGHGLDGGNPWDPVEVPS